MSVRPSATFYAACKALQAAGPYHIYICLDDSNYTPPGYDGSIPLIQVEASEAEAAGYKGSVLYFKERACARDKALYYFTYRHTIPFEYVWFLEDDVFLPTAHTLPAIDTKWSQYDLLSKAHMVESGRPTGWHWQHIFSQTSIPPPYASSMICAIRVSKPLLEAIRIYAQTYKGLFMDEALFNTLALQAGLRVGCPRELSTIEYQARWEEWEIQSSHLYHPIKDVAEHDRLRGALSHEEGGLCGWLRGLTL